ncbi:baseplate wedge subunit protein [Rhizobium phage RHph_I1_18]|nr:baseplate wedge subunit protein [Rhizobium phage RHph_I1_18]
MAIFLKNLYRHLLKTSVYDPIKNGSANSVFYFVAGRNQEWEGGPFIPDVETGSYSQIQQTRADMICGTRIKPSQVAFIGNRNVWTSGVVYSNYNDDVHTQPFYVINSTNDLYKCISNNNGATSTEEPTSLSSSGTFKTSDGYIWKYMGTVSTNDLSLFGTSSTIPLIPNANIVANAISGTIDAISVIDGGNSYNRYGTGTVGALVANNIVRVNGLPDEGQGFYIDCSFYVAGGTGSGSLRTITQSTSNGLGNFLTLNQSVNVDVTSQYIVSPRLVITGDGSGASGFVNVSDGKISNVVIVTTGTDYTSATVTVTSTSPAELKAHVSTSGGHGSDIVAEFDCSSLAVVSEFTKEIDDYLPDDITYYQFALLKDPKNLSGNLLTANTVAFTTHLNAGGAVFTVGERVRGAESNAHGTVMSSNAAVTFIKDVRGTFEDAETVTGETSGIHGESANVFTSSYDKDTGELFYYSDVSAINRSDTIISERIRCSINLEG